MEARASPLASPGQPCDEYGVCYDSDIGGGGWRDWRPRPIKTSSNPIEYCK